MPNDHLRTWTSDDFRFRLDLWDTGRTDRDGRSLLRYTLFDADMPNGKGIVADGADFRPSPLHAIDSDETVKACLELLAYGSDENESWPASHRQDLSDAIYCSELGQIED